MYILYIFWKITRGNVPKKRVASIIVLESNRWPLIESWGSQRFCPSYFLCCFLTQFFWILQRKTWWRRAGACWRRHRGSRRGDGVRDEGGWVAARVFFAEFQKLGSKAFLFPSFFVYLVFFFLQTAWRSSESPSGGQYRHDHLLLEHTKNTGDTVGLDS